MSQRQQLRLISRDLSLDDPFSHKHSNESGLLAKYENEHGNQETFLNSSQEAFNLQVQLTTRLYIEYASVHFIGWYAWRWELE